MDQQDVVASAAPPPDVEKVLEHYRREFDVEDWLDKAEKHEYNEVRPMSLVAELRFLSGLICFGSAVRRFRKGACNLHALRPPPKPGN